jgi:hypothetical protein
MSNKNKGRTGGQSGSGSASQSEPSSSQQAAPAGSGGTVLNLSGMRQAEGRGSLARIIKDKEGNDTIVDFWYDVTRLDAVKLEAVMGIAKTDTTYDLTAFIRAIEYQGFDREFYIKYCLARMSVSMFCRFAILGAIRGSNFTRILETCENMPQDMVTGFTSLGFVKTPKKRDHITILRCTASVPHWCAFYLQKAAVEKKIAVECPAPLQFPGAASLPMSKTVRLQHMDFCVRFSALLSGGSFSMTIYLTAMSNLIPVSDIPHEVLSILRVASTSESHLLTEDEVSQYGKQVVVKR